MKYRYLVAILVLLSTKLFSQDIHFSQFDATPLQINPALTGRFDGDLRFVGNYRNQWASITTPYKTTALSLDSKSDFKYLKKSTIAYGVQLMNDKAGDSDFGTTGFGLNLAFHKGFLRDSSLVLSLGAVLGYNQLSINYTNLSFNNQFDGYQYNPNLPSGMTPTDNRFSFFDFTAGTNLYYRINKTASFGSGFAIHHLSKPEYSWFSENPISLNRRFVFHGVCEIKTRFYTHFLPSFLVMQQGKYNEIAAGGTIKFVTEQAYIPAFYLGSWYRVRDASIVKVGVDYRNLNIGFSYDINNSRLMNASNGDGGIEISVIYIYRLPQIIVPRNKRCPTFM